MGLSKINGLTVILITLLLLAVNVFAETTFFDQDDVFIMGDSTTGGAYCGDGSCNNSETCSSCAADCGACPPSGGSSLGGCVTNWTCTAWSACSGGTQTRSCSKVLSYCYANWQPEVSRNCNVEEIASINTEQPAASNATEQPAAPAAAAPVQPTDVLGAEANPSPAGIWPVGGFAIFANEKEFVVSAVFAIIVIAYTAITMRAKKAKAQ